MSNASKSKKLTQNLKTNLVESMLQGQRLSLARLISKIENRAPEVPDLMKQIYPCTGKAQIWGITGPPGAGKSSLVDRITSILRTQGKKVGIVAIDPSSPFSGGAILGDRIRMQRHAEDPDVFIRSLGTRGKHGGLSHATKEVVLTLDAAGFDTIIVETAGVGQTELDILRLAQTILVVLVPESGDSIQVMKAGMMEIADVFAVNKSDRPEADQLIRELITMVGMSPHDAQRWLSPVLKTQAVTQGKKNQSTGIEELIQAIEKHQTYLTQSGKRTLKAKEFLMNEVSDILIERLSETVLATFQTTSGVDIISQLINKEIDPYQAADILSNQ